MLFAVATIATLFAWYGLGTWLPNLMQLAGYNLGSALTFALALNLGAVAGSVITAWAGTRFGPIPTAIAAAAVAAGALVVLVTGPPVGVVYFMLVLAGVGTHGTQCLIIAAVASHYPGAPAGDRAGLGARHRAASAPSPHRRWAASCWPPDWASIPTSWPSPGQPPSPRCCWPPSASNSSQNSQSPQRSKQCLSTPRPPMSSSSEGEWPDWPEPSHCVKTAPR